MKIIDLIGQEFEKLKVLERSENSKSGRVRWLCQCNCKDKSRVIVYGSHLRSGHTKSCGCLHVQHGHAQKGKISGIYSSWQHMKQRCINSNHKHYKYYGDRGITICERWLNSFENFLEDMVECSPGLTLERKNNKKGYSLENCRWATRKEQQRNTRRNHLETHNNITQCRSIWAEEFGINYKTFEGRLNDGWSMEKALTTPVRNFRKNNYENIQN